MPTLQRPPRWRRAFIAFSFSGLVAFTSAATVSNAPTSTSSASTGPQTHVVLVGSGGDYQYHPNSIGANVGDVINFQFYPTNHSVIRGEYTESNACGDAGCNPCVPIELIDPTVPPFHSKNFLTQDLPSPDNLALQSYNLTVKDTNPIWFYCDAIDSCLNGMVGVINPQNGSSIDKQIAAAQAAKFQLSPGEQWPAEGMQPGSQAATPSNSSTPAGTSNSTASNAAMTHDHHMTGGAIAGIAVGAAVVIVLCAALCYFVGRANTYRDVLKSTKQQTEGLPSHYGDGTGSLPPPPMSPVDPGMQQQQLTPPPPPLAGGWDHRFSGQTQFSAVPPGMMDAGAALPAGTFIGYNRMTGAPEFAQEAPALAPGDGEHYHDDAKLSPPIGYHGQQEPNVVTDQTHELPGETVPVAEVGPYK